MKVKVISSKVESEKMGLKSPDLFFAEREVRKLKQKSVSDEVAESLIHFRNYKWNGADLDFPLHPKLRTVTKYYPEAKGGPLLIDEPKFLEAEKECELKGQMIRARGLRYLVIKQGMSLQKVLEEMHTCLGQAS